MYLSNLYSKINRCSKSDTECIFNNYTKFIKWSECVNVLDLGCGLGDVTKHLLLPLLPTDVKSLTGCDISDNMLEFAKIHNSHSKINYVKLDIAKDIPVCLEGYFDHIFSFYCIHWIKNSRTVFTNIRKLLEPGGGIYVHYVADCYVFNSYKHLADMPKWKRYMTDVDMFIPETVNCEDAEDKTRIQIMQLGFKIQKCDLLERHYTFNSCEEFKDFIKCINPFLNRIPIHLHQEYITDLQKENVKQINEVQIETNGKVHHSYKTLAIVAEKDV